MKMPAKEETHFEYCLQYNVTLFNPAVSFFGRTYRGRRIALRTEGEELASNEGEWVLFYTQSEAIETKAVVEVVLFETDKAKGTSKTYGVGYGVVPLFYD